MKSLSWYIIQTKPAQEEWVRRRWEEAGYEIFLPKIKKLVRGGGRVTERIRSLFPSYLFARLDFEDAETYKNVKYTRGVRRILGNGGSPIPVAEKVIDVIRERVDDHGILVLEERLTFKKGDSIQVKSGPLADLIGVLEQPVSASGRVRVLLQAYHRTIPTTISLSDIERI